MKPLTILNFLPVLSFCFPAAARVVRPRQAPGAAQNVTTITSPSGVTIRYKEPGKEGICEITPGVNSYSGYIDVAPDVHVFFYFFESKRDPANDPVSNDFQRRANILGLLTCAVQGYSLVERRSRLGFFDWSV